MDRIEIKGGNKLEGEVFISGAKNAALPFLASTILVDGQTSISNVPDLMDIKSILLLLQGPLDSDRCTSKSTQHLDRSIRATGDVYRLTIIPLCHHPGKSM